MMAPLQLPECLLTCTSSHAPNSPLSFYFALASKKPASSRATTRMKLRFTSPKKGATNIRQASRSSILQLPTRDVFGDFTASAVFDGNHEGPCEKSYLRAVLVLHPVRSKPSMRNGRSSSGRVFSRISLTSRGSRDFCYIRFPIARG